MKKRILVVDVGGNNVKVSMAGRKEPLRIPSGPEMTAARMVTDVRKAVAGWKYDVVSIGFPGAVKNGRPGHEPRNLGGGWMRFNFRRGFGKPVKVLNDAAMQALGSYEGGRMLFLGLGTGLGSALIAEGVLMPMELAHLPYRNGRTYEDYVGERGLLRLGPKKWTRHVRKVVEVLRHGLQADHVVLGGGQVKKLKKLPTGVRVGGNEHAILGGLRIWEGPRPSRRRKVSVARSAKTARTAAASVVAPPADAPAPPPPID